MKYNSPNALTDVAEFHRYFGHPVIEQPSIPDKKRASLRVSLLQEELNELKVAIESKDLVEVADALTDIQYVLAGAILEFGLADKFKELFEEVHRSNMSKACDTKQEAIETMAHYKIKKGTDSTAKQIEGKWLVSRLEDGKTLKNIKYSPANLLPILNK